MRGACTDVYVVQHIFGATERISVAAPNGATINANAGKIQNGIGAIPEDPRQLSGPNPLLYGH
jgi:hypothetical protein